MMPMLHDEVWIPFSLAELAADESLPFDDPDAYIPYLIEKWPPGGKPHRVEHYLPELAPPPGRRRPPPGVHGWLVFRMPPTEPEPDPEAPTIDWDAIRDARVVDRRRSRKRPGTD
ncbi:hypothetical protein [Mycobacterium sp. 155]|uniref:hypothetical protein n=1 Tax=Mycobacterium sp. 155 TaxID=1157943 RepID=UPI000373ECB1|nr:hypothetical protein [Mycobacterium sp. 155]